MSSLRERLQLAVEEHPERIVQAIAVHEVLGLGLMLGCWLGCYRLAPTQALLRSAPLQALAGRLSSWRPGYVEQLRERARAAQQRSALFKRVHAVAQRWPGVSPQRLTASFAESWLLRRLLAPVTVPGKVLLTYHILSAWHRTD